MYRTAAESETMVVDPDIWEAVWVFSFLSTQWQTAGMGGVRVGIPHERVEATFRLLEIPRRRRKQLFLDVKTMERESCAIYAERAKAAQERSRS